MTTRFPIFACLLLAIVFAIERPTLAAPSDPGSGFPLGPCAYIGAATATEAPPQGPDSAPSEPPDAEARRNRELAVRPFFFAACLTAGAIIGMLLVSWWRKRKGRHLRA